MFLRLQRLVRQPAIVASLIATALLISIQRTGVLQLFELRVFDQMTQGQANQPPDPRLVVVTVTEQDLQDLRQFSLSDQVLAQLLTKLARYQPRVIGVDIFRDLPVRPGHQALRQHLQVDDRTVMICKHENLGNPAVPAPLGMGVDQIGFSDIVEDSDGVIRRNLLLVTPNLRSRCGARESFSWQLVSRYLGTQPTWTGDRGQWGKAQLSRLQPSTGGYQLTPPEAQGYQILLQYRSPVAQQVSLMDVLNDRVNPRWIKDRIVLVGTTAPSVKDIFNTPYSDNQPNNSGKMAGILLHAQMTSQLLSAVTDGRSLFWGWPDGGEWVWAWGWSWLGGAIALRYRRPLPLGLVLSTALGSLVLINMAIFSQSGWIPLGPPLFGLVLTSLGIVGYHVQQNIQQQRQMMQKLQDQASTIAMLQAMLRQTELAAEQTLATTTTMTDCPRRSGLLNQRYRITNLLGTGGFSRTYLAEDTQATPQPCCVVKHLLPARNDEQFLQLARRLFKTEADILALLGQHAHIPQLLAYFEEQQEFYLVQEYIPGVPLENELRADESLTERQVLALLKDVLEILMFVHSQGVIHRDVKPSNLIRRTDGRIAMIDFGAVKQIQPHSPEENFTVAIGTLGYAPPEQFIGQPRLNSDIYALGMIAIQALTGVAVKQLQRDVTTGALVWQHLATVSPPLATILDRMTAYDFHQRYASATEVLQVLAKLPAG